MARNPLNNSDSNDKKQARALAVALIVLITVLLATAIMLLPAVGELTSAHLAPGLGLKDAALIAFFTTVVLMTVFAVAAGDGFIGEIQFMLAGFFLFFVVIWLLLAWIF